jgi:hypothetical protein
MEYQFVSLLVNLSPSTTESPPPEGNFYRVAVPEDIQEGFPDPSTWPEPTATLEPAGCDPLEYFQNHTIIFGELVLFSQCDQRY